MLLIVVKFPLFKVEHKESITILELLFIEVRDSMSCLFALLLLYDIDMACALKVLLDGA